MRLRLDERWVSRVGRLPEDGMGYHVVDVRLRGGEYVRGVVVLNSQDIQWPTDRAEVAVEDIVEIRSTQR